MPRCLPMQVGSSSCPAPVFLGKLLHCSPLTVVCPGMVLKASQFHLMSTKTLMLPQLPRLVDPWLQCCKCDSRMGSQEHERKQERKPGLGARGSRTKQKVQRTWEAPFPSRSKNRRE